MPPDSIANLLLHLTSKDDATDDLGRVTAAVEALDSQEANVNVDVDTGGAESQLALFASELEALDGTEVNVSADVDFSQLELFTKRLEELNNRDFTGKFMKGAPTGAFTELTQGTEQLKLDVDTSGIAQAFTQLSLLDAELAHLDGRHVEVNVDVDRNKLSGILGTLTGLFSKVSSLGANIGSSLGQASVGGQKLADVLGGLTVNIGSFGARLGPVVAGILALIAVIATGLVGALAAMAAGLLAAAVFAGGLAVALGGVLVPIIAVALPALISMANVLKVLQARQQEAAQATELKAQADQDALVYSRQHADAIRSLEAAIQNQADTEKQSAQQVSDAQRQRTLSVENLRSATVNAYQEMADAIEAASDAERSLERARLSEDQAALGVKEAVNNLKNFRKETKTAGSALDGMFKKFTDVNFKGNSEAIVGQLREATGGSLGTDKELELQRLILGVRDARLRQKEATDGVSDAETTLARAQEKARKFQTEGIRASDQYVTALRAVEDSRRQVTRAEEAAASREAAAIAQVADARRQLTRLKEDRRYQIEHGNLKKSEQLTRNLSGAERNLLGALTEVWGHVKQAFGPASQGLVNALANGIKKLIPLIDKLKTPFQILGGVLAGTLTRFFDTLASPAVADAFTALVIGASQAAPAIGSIFGSLLTLILQIAQAALPFLIVALQTFAGILQGFVTSTGATGFHDLFAKLEPIFYSLLGVGTAFANAIFAFMVAVGPYAQVFFDAIAGVANRFAEWANSAAGRAEIKNFFDSTVPMVVKFAKFVWNIIVFFIRLTEAAGPLVAAILDLFNAGLEIVNTFLHAIGILTNVIGELVGIFTGVFESIISKLTGFIDSFLALGKAIIQGLINGIKSKAGDAVDAITDIPGKAIDKAGDILGIGSPSRVFKQMGVDVGRGFEIGLNASATRVAQAASSSLAAPVLATGASLAPLGGRGAGGVTIEKQDVILPAAPGHDQMGDARTQAQEFAREMRRRGSGSL